jgi:hypothetical protein
MVLQNGGSARVISNGARHSSSYRQLASVSPAAGRGRAAAFCIAVIVSLAWGALPVIVIHWCDILCCPVLGRTGLCAGTESEAGSGSPSSDVPADHVTAVLTALFDLTRAMNMAEQHDVVGQVRWRRRTDGSSQEIRRLQVIRQVTHLGGDALRDRV